MDLTKIARASHLVDSVDRAIATRQTKINGLAADLANDPARALEWSNDHFRTAVEIRILKTLRAWCVRRAFGNEHSAAQPDVTFEEMRESIIEQYQYTTAVPRSTSVTSNLIDAHIADAINDVRNQSYALGLNSIFYEAQTRDPEVRAAMSAAAEARAAERAAAEAAKAEVRRQEKLAARRNRRAK